MALAEATHHSAPRGQMTARARGEERDELHDAKGLMTPPPSWPTPLVEVRPQGRVLRHAVEGLGEFAPMVQILDAPVPQMLCGGSLTVTGSTDCRAGYRSVHSLLLSVSIAFSCSCSAVSGTVGGSADHSDSHAHRLADRGVDIPPSACGVSGSFQGFPPEQSSAQRSASQIADIPVPGRGVFGSAQGSLPEQSMAKRTASQIADFPVPGRGSSGCLLDSLPEQRTTALHVAQERISERIERINAGGDFPSRRAGPRVVRPRQRSAAAGAEQLADIVSSGGPHGSPRTEFSSSFWN